MKRLIKVAFNDLRLVFRDSSLNFFFIFPILNLFVVYYGFPLVIDKFEVLADYVPILLMFLANQGALIYGFIYSMVLIDEKDTNVSKVYGVLPVSKFWFVLIRLIAPFLFATVSTVLVFLVEPFYQFSFGINLVYSALSGLIAPLMVLFVAIMANNKLEGMTYQKLFNIPVTIPVLAFFVPAVFATLFAIFPTYWAYQGFINLVNGKSFVGFLTVGFIYNLLLILLMARKFSKVHFQ